MGLFDLFKNNKKPNNTTTDNGVLGPTYLDGFTEHIENPKDLLSHEWRRKLITPAGQSKFKIKFFGRVHEKYKNLIVGTDIAPLLVLAVDNSTKKEILLFDGCKHGYNALFCDKFTDEQIKNRPTTNFYKDKNGNEVFEIVISTYNGIDYEHELEDQVDENGLVELVDGTKLELNKVICNGFNTLQIWATNESGDTINIVSEELS